VKTGRDGSTGWVHVDRWAGLHAACPRPFPQVGRNVPSTGRDCPRREKLMRAHLDRAE
jgi:hypothetical protein